MPVLIDFENEYFDRLCSIVKVNKFQFIVPIVSTIILALFFSYFVLSLVFNGSPTSVFEGSDKFFVELNIFIIVIASLTSLLIFFHYFRREPELVVKLFVAIFILSGILSTLLFAKFIFNYLSLEFPLILFFVALVTYVGAYFAYLIIVDSLSEKTKNMLFIYSSAALGAFIGIITPPILVIVLSVCLSALDLILIERKIVQKFLGEIQYERVITQISFSKREWGIGIGDLTCYSIIVANTLLNFGLIAGGLSVLMILIGSLASLSLIFRKTWVPGLPISITLGLLPSLTILLL
jgi:hypothetical protein